MVRPYFFRREDALLEEGLGCVAGIDDVGRGSFAGPLVMGVVVYDSFLKRLKGLNDSKRVSLIKRCDLFKQIVDRCNFAVGFAWPLEIDGMGLTRASALAGKRALASLRNHFSVVPDLILLDGKYKLDFGIETECFVGGDSRIRSIAAASVIAKVFRDKLMANYSVMYDGFAWESHVGYGTRAHRSMLESNGPTRIHRKLFLSGVNGS